MTRKMLVLLCAAATTAVSAHALTPYVHGGLADMGRGDWLEPADGATILYPTFWGATFYLGGGFSYDLKQYRTPSVLPTLCLDTDVGFTRAHAEWLNVDPEGWEQTYYELMVAEVFVFRLRIPVLSRLLTPYLGVGGGVAIAPNSIKRIPGTPNSDRPGYYESSAVAVEPLYAVPFGLEITLTPRNTIYARFGAMAPSGRAKLEYINDADRAIPVETEIPNNFMVLFGYKWGI